MTNEELLKLIQQAQTAGKVVTNIDKAIPLPVGSKTLLGFLGTLVTGAVSVVATNPGILDFSSGDWKSSLATLLALGFTALMGAGGISKWQRQIDVVQQSVEVLQQVLKRLEEPKQDI